MFSAALVPRADGCQPQQKTGTAVPVLDENDEGACGARGARKEGRENLFTAVVDKLSPKIRRRRLQRRKEEQEYRATLLQIAVHEEQPRPDQEEQPRPAQDEEQPKKRPKRKSARFTCKGCEATKPAEVYARLPSGKTGQRLP